jgi:probable HAF family extracellular repeat protein
MRMSAFIRSAFAAGPGLALILASSLAAGPVPAVVSGIDVAAAAPVYRLVDLGTLGGDSSFATAMNDRGAVVGRAQTADGAYHGFLWRHAAMVDLGPFSPTDINNKGQIVGTRDDASGAFLWSRGTLVPLGGRITFPKAINDRGQVVGMMAVDGGPDVPALWSRGTVRPLPLDDVSDINNRTQISGGRVSGVNGFHASVWRRGRVTDLGAAAFDRSNTYGINDRGWVLGWVFSARQYERGVLWRHGRRTDIGTLGGNATHPVAINERGVVLVTSQLPDGNVHPALWRRGVLTDLTAAGVGADSDLADYNNKGEIAASIRPVFGIAHAVIYRPLGR